ncbi:GTPase Era [Ructibacterium gallinarum]|uniref:GTPase Era n=1 Tax=Ructibacterium gallinarum TaxID=2779355 RepID=A0A9D5M3L2_9FIRM|nr:GTPase Era [Ructibacterium gallinarum]MBE5040064.1 GTPase Era [Ructibacterium gallinarum]
MKSGFIAITGRPNAGKSTLLNRIVGEKVAIVSNKPQTTRTKILGVYTEKDLQAVLIDTPGIHKPHNKLGKRMEKYIYTATQDIDALIYVVDCGIRPEETEVEKKALAGLKTSGIPVILAVNKIDTKERLQLLPVLDRLKDMYDFSDIVPISAKTGENLPELFKKIKECLKEGPKFFPDDVITDQPERQIVSEFIREKALRLLNKEVPHGIAVEIERMKQRENGTYEILAAIYCEKQSHKGIIIGKGGEKLKQIGRQAREDIERFLGAKVYLELWVRVKEDWRNKENFMTDIGFE